MRKRISDIILSMITLAGCALLAATPVSAAVNGGGYAASGQIENVARKYAIDKILTGEPSTLDDLNNYCQCETLGGSAFGRLGFC